MPGEGPRNCLCVGVVGEGHGGAEGTVEGEMVPFGGKTEGLVIDDSRVVCYRSEVAGEVWDCGWCQWHPLDS